MKLKKLMIVVLMFVSVTLFCGCADIQYIRTVDDYGAVLDRIIVELDEKEIKEKYDNDITFVSAFRNLKDSIHKDFQTYEKAVNEWKETFTFDAGLYNLVNEGITMFITHNEANTNVLSFEIRFANQGLFMLFYGTEVTYNGEPLQVDSIMTRDLGPYLNDDVVEDLQNYTPFLYKQSLVESESFISNVETEQYFKSNKISYFDKYSNYLHFGEIFDIDDVEFSQIYATTDERLYTNSEDVMVNAGLYHHYWSVDSNSSLKFYGVIPNITSWYLIALAIALVVIVSIFIYCKKDVVIKKMAKLKMKQKPESEFTDEDNDLNGGSLE